MTLGAGTGGLLGDRIGRKTTLIGSVVLFALATAAVAGIHGVAALAVLRLLAGFGIGSVFPTASALAAEFSPRRNRCLAVAGTIVCVPLGGTVGGLVAAFVLPAFGWRALFILGGVSPLVIALLLFFLLPETPRFLARVPHRAAEACRLLSRLGHSVPEDARLVDGGEAGETSRAGLSALFGPLYRHDTLVLWAAFFFSLFAVYTVFNWAPTLITSLGLDIATASRAVRPTTSAG